MKCQRVITKAAASTSAIIDGSASNCSLEYHTTANWGQSLPVLHPSVSFANINFPPPEAFSNSDMSTEDKKEPKRNAKPPIPAKPIFVANRNMNNNNVTPSLTGTINGTTKLKNLMLLREPTKKPSIRQVFDDEEDSCDSLSDTDDSIDESDNDETLTKEDTKSTGEASAVSAISTSSYDQITEENKGQYILAKITIPDQKLTKCMQLKIDQTVWSAKQRILQSLAKKLHDPLNYGLYHEKARMLLLDHKPMLEYIEAGSVGTLQMRYKCRKTENHPRNSKEGRHHTKMQSASKQKDFLLHVQQYSTDKIYSLIRKGIDPNFQCPNTGETPLTILSSGQSRSECVSVFMALLGGGAHLDYRNQRGFTPMHVAARNGNIQMLKTLLEFKASPNVVDGRDLTPLYHCVLLGSDHETARVLLAHGATVGCSDSQGWSEIHQACRHGRLQLLELLLDCDNIDGDMINARNASGNTPLHVCTLYNQELCAATLLMHGADASLRNFSNQDAVQVAHVASNVSLAELISDFPNRRDYAEHSLMRARAETTAAKPPLPTRQEQSPKRNKKQDRSTWTPNTLAKHSRQYMLHNQHSVSGTLGRTKDSYTSAMPSENRFDSKLPPNAKIPDVNYPKSAGNDAVDDNKVRIVVRNYDAKTSDDLTLRVGTRVIVLNARSAPPGYHDGMVGDQRGFFPKDCVEEVKLRRPLPDTGQKQRVTSDNPYEKRDSGKFKGSFKKHRSGADSPMTQRSTMPDCVSVVSFESHDDGHSGSPGRISSARIEDLAQFQTTSTPGVYHNNRSVALWKGNDGFGFILRGAKSEGPLHDFNPSAKIPGLQYVESVENGSNAYNAGLRPGDFIIKIGDADVRRYGHQQLVDRIRACGEPLHMQVITVEHSAPNGDAASIHSNQLDNVLAMDDATADASERTASVRRVPGRKVEGHQLQNLFRQNGTAEAIATLPRQPQQSTFSSVRKPIHVLPPSLSNANTFQYESADSQQPQEGTRGTRSMSASASAYPTWCKASGLPPLEKDFRSRSVSGVTGERLLIQSGAKSKRMPPPPPKRIDSRLSVSIPEEETSVKSRHIFSSQTLKSRNTQHSTNAHVNTQSDMAAVIAAAARNRAQRFSQSELQKKNQSQERPPLTPEPEALAVVETPMKSVAEISSALSLALAAKKRILDQQKTPAKSPEVKKPSGSFTVNSAKSFVQRNERHVLPPPPMCNLPPPPPLSDYDDVTGLAFPPPPPAFPAPDPHHAAFDELMNLPPPPSDLLPNPMQDSREIQKNSENPNPGTLSFLPPPPIPPTADDDDGCASPGGADNLSNADSGIADVAGDGLNLSHYHRNTISEHHGHDHVSGDDHSTVSSLSTTSTMSSEDAGPDFPAPFSQPISERVWPFRQARKESEDGNGANGSHSSNSTGNIYLDVLKKSKSKPQQPTSTTISNDPRKNLCPGVTVTKMTFAPFTGLPPPVEEAEQKAAKATTVFPPAPKEYSNVETKPLFGKVPPGGGGVGSVQTRKFGITPKVSPAPVENAPIKTTPAIAPSNPAAKVTVNPAASSKTNESPVKVPSLGDSGCSQTIKPLAQWSVSDVSDWLKDLGLQMYVSSFEENEISGEHLPDLGKGELIELGVKPFGHRLTIDRSIKKLVGA